MNQLKAKAASASQQDAIALLMQDHQTVEKLFKQFEKLVKAEDDKGKEDVVKQICHELTVHAQVEEEIFYPAVREAIGDEDLLDEAEVEHASVKELVAQLESMQPGDDLYDAKVTVLGEYVRHHVKEEEGEMFPKAKKAKMDFMTMGEEIIGAKEAMLKPVKKSVPKISRPSPKSSRSLR